MGDAGGGSIWEDGLGRRDADARVLWGDETAHAPDPQSVRYGDGSPARVAVQAVIGGPAFRRRPLVDVSWHEGLRPIYARLTPVEARRIAAMLARAADEADRQGGAEGSG